MVCDLPRRPRAAQQRIQQALLDINTLALEIKKLTGNQADPYKEWEITEYLPDVEARLLGIAAGLGLAWFATNALDVPFVIDATVAAVAFGFSAVACLIAAAASLAGAASPAARPRATC